MSSFKQWLFRMTARFWLVFFLFCSVSLLLSFSDSLCILNIDLYSEALFANFHFCSMDTLFSVHCFFGGKEALRFVAVPIACFLCLCFLYLLDLSLLFTSFLLLNYIEKSECYRLTIHFSTLERQNIIVSDFCNKTACLGISLASVVFFFL